eukprot:1233137-Prorocentrum_lima.AAC.1
MTSSLVGSEMCIRDSLFPPAPPLPDAPVQSGSQEAEDRSAPTRFLTPVSYTHLTLPTICSV